MDEIIISAHFPFDEVDDDINHRLNMLEELNRNGSSIDEYKDFHSIATIEWELVSNLFEVYILGESITDAAVITSSICRFAPLDSYDNFLTFVVLPIILDLGTYRVLEEVKVNSYLTDKEISYHSLYRNDNHGLVITFKCV